ncbi:tail fiber protein [Jannaschia sp.]|nr:tail fiber protein [Jannaschia sp.]
MKRIASLACGAVLSLLALPAAAQERYIGEIFPNGYNFCPRGSAGADGQLLAISQNQALFSLIGTIYGGDGRTTFALPDLRGRAPLHNGTGPGLSNLQIGGRGGNEQTSLTEANLPPHSHSVNATNADGDKPGPGGKILAAAPVDGTGQETIYSDEAPNRIMDTRMIGSTGNSQSVDILDPYTTINYCIWITGIFPSRP